MAGLRAEGTGTTKVPWKADFNELPRLRSPWGVSICVVANPTHVAFGRLCRVDTSAHVIDRPIEGRWRISICDNHSDWETGYLNLYPHGKSVPGELTASWPDLFPVFGDHQKYQWLHYEQLTIILQSLVLDVQRGTNRWSQTRRKLASLPEQAQDSI